MIRRSSGQYVAPTQLRAKRSNALQFRMPVARRTTRPPSYAPSRPRACVSARKARAPCWPSPTQAAANVDSSDLALREASGESRSEPLSFPRRPQAIPRRVPAPLRPDAGDAGNGAEPRVRPWLTNRPRPTSRLWRRRPPGRGARCWRRWRPRCGAGRRLRGSRRRTRRGGGGMRGGRYEPVLG